VLAGPGAAPLNRLRGAIESFQETGARIRLPYYLGLLADACLRAGDIEAGLQVTEEALSRAREMNERWWDAELYRLRAETMQATFAPPEEVEAVLIRALEIARAQQARSLELRAANTLARLWAGSGRSAAARDLLTPVYSWFTEGLGSPEMDQARALLSTLG
jgi:predicted ATPase